MQASICTLYPPHYDAVSSLAAHKDLLFSSCGVTIKQWDIKERSLKHVCKNISTPTTGSKQVVQPHAIAPPWVWLIMSLQNGCGSLHHYNDCGSLCGVIHQHNGCGSVHYNGCGSLHWRNRCGSQWECQYLQWEWFIWMVVHWCNGSGSLVQWGYC
jgi:hypothetical protein